MKEIKIQELENIKIGSAENKDAATGCTVILCEQGKDVPIRHRTWWIAMKLKMVFL